ncbi:MAG: S8 family serine peptidase [Alphaproteobacteria bacterium]
MKKIARHSAQKVFIASLLLSGMSALYQPSLAVAAATPPTPWIEAATRLQSAGQQGNFLSRLQIEMQTNPKAALFLAGTAIVQQPTQKDAVIRAYQAFQHVSSLSEKEKNYFALCLKQPITASTKNHTSNFAARSVSSPLALPSMGRISLGSPAPSLSSSVFASSAPAAFETGMALAGIGAGTAAIAVAVSAGKSDKKTTITSPTTPNPTDFITDEFNKQYGLSQMGAQYAYARGATGRGVVVAVGDSGVDASHPDLAANIYKIFPSGVSQITDFVDNDSDSNPTAGSDNSGFSHGTEVSGVIAAVKNNSGMHGVAYDAQILPLRVFDSSGAGSFLAALQSIDYIAANAAALGVKVYNASYGTTQVAAGDDIGSALASFTALKNAGVVLVAAAGNDGDGVPVSFPANLPLVQGGSGLQSHLLAVVAVDNANNISSFSTRCGTSKNWCLAAGGESIYTTRATTDPNGAGAQYNTVDGTSFAAPQVSGALAVLLTMFPGLSTDQAVQLLLTTAKDLGAAGVDDVYGYGLVDLGNATKPQGGLGIASTNNVDGQKQNLQEAGFVTSPVLSKLKDTNLKLMVLDSYNRAYMLPISSLVQHNDGKVEIGVNQNIFFRPPAVQNLRLANGVSLQVITPDVSGHDVNDSPDKQLRLTAEMAPGKTVTMHWQTPAADIMSLGAQHHLTSDQRITQGKGLDHPYLGLLGAGMGSEVKTTLKGGDKLSVGFYTGKDKETNLPLNDKKHGFGALAGWRTSLAAGNQLGLQGGMVSEQKSLLGGYGSGALQLDSTHTAFAGITAEQQLRQGLSLIGGIYGGVSTAKGSRNSLFGGFSPIKSSSFSLGLLGNGLVEEQDRYGIILSQPLRVNSGKANLDIPTARDALGNITRSNYSLSLAPTAQEMSLESFYQIGLTDNTDVTGSVLLRHHPDNDSTKAVGADIGVKLNHKL